MARFGAHGAGLLALSVIGFLAGPAGAATIAGGASHTLVVKTTDNTVWAWGLNSDGQLGDNTVTQRKTPQQVSGLANVVAVAAGAKHSLALRSDGVLFGWGDNLYGQIGNGNNTDQKLPVQILTGVAFVAAGDYHTVALKTDGTVMTWGYNNEGQIGDGSTTNRNTPYQVTGLGLVGYVAAGASHTVVVLSGGGGLKAWGKNTNGQLGDGTTTRATSPVSVTGVTTATTVAGGAAFTMSRQVAGTVSSWGFNNVGQLGLGDTTQRTTAQPVNGLSSVTALAAGAAHALALSSGGAVSAWGYNAYGSVGDASTTNRTSPVGVPGLSSIVAIGTGQHHSLAVTSTGEVWVWGYNNYSQLGDGTTANQLSPIQIAQAGFNWRVATPTFSPVPGTYSANQNVTITCATTGVTIRYTTNGSEPTSSSTLYSAAVPLTVSTTLKARAFKSGLADSLTAAGLYTLKVATPTLSPAGGTYTTGQTVTMTVATTGAAIRYTSDGSDPTAASTLYAAPVSVATTTTLKAAGFKTGWTTSDIRSGSYTMNFGTLAAPSFSPAPAGYLDAVAVTISATAGATIRYTTDGATPGLSSAVYGSPLGLTQTTVLKAKAWKVDYTESAVSSGTYTLKVATPLLSRAPGSYPAGTSVTVTAATAGATLNYTLDGSDPTESDPAIGSGGSIVLGNYTLKVRSFKTFCDPSDVVTATYTVTGQLTPGMVAAGQNFSLALLPDGTVFSWGYNANGRLGDGTTTERWMPGPVDGLTGVVGISAGLTHSVAVDTTGRVWSWGINSSGQIGDGTTTERRMPVLVPGLANVVAVAAGSACSAALKADGSLWLWGENGLGQLGLGDTTDRLSPVQAMSSVAAVALGWSHVVVARTDGSVWSWGSNNAGQLGDGGTTNRSTPAQVSGLASVVRVAAGQSHSMAQLTTGGIYAWGENGSSQLGDGTTTDQRTPALLTALQGTVALDGGGLHSLAALPAGIAQGWGSNAFGQVGDGTTTTRSLPTTVIGPAAVIHVSAGEQHSLAISSNGSIWAWGSNANGRLGDGTSANRATPVKVRDGGSWRVSTPTLTPTGGAYTAVQTVTIADNTPGAVIRYTTDGSDPSPSSTQVASGGTVSVDHSLTLKAKAWKAGMADSDVATASYSLTVATPTISPAGGTFNVPQTVTIACAVAGATIRYTTSGVDPTPADAVVASGGTISVDASQTVKAKAWKSGWSDSAVVSRAFTMVVAPPTMTPPGGNYATSQAVTLATLTPGATVRYTTNGLEPTPTDPAGTLVTVSESLSLKAVAFKPGWTTSTTTLENYWLNLGAVATPTFAPAGGTYAGPQTVVISSATGATIRYTRDGTEPTLASPVYVTPLAVPVSATIKARAFKADYSPSATAAAVYTLDVAAVAPPLLAPGGGTYAAGLRVVVTSQTPGATLRYTTDGTDPDIGDPVVASGGVVAVGRSTRLAVRAWQAGLAASPVSVADYNVVGGVATAGYSSLVLVADGTVWAFGQNTYGQLGNGTQTDSALPVQVLTDTGPLTDVVAIAAGSRHRLALRADRSVWAWGRNQSGQLGDGTSVTRTKAVQVLTSTGPLTDIVGIAAGDGHSLALKADGSVWSWGANGNGQLGDGTLTTPPPFASQVPSLSAVVAVAAGDNHSAAVAESGRLWVWGLNGLGQLGDGSSATRSQPIRVGTGVAFVGCGVDFTHRVLGDGTVVGSGANNWGELGDGTLTTPRLLPVSVLGPTSLTQVSGGTNHTLALRADGVVFGTGRDLNGELGDASVVTKSSMVHSAWIAEVVRVAAGFGSSLAVDRHGQVFVWGLGAYGQLGLGDTSSRTIPTLLDLRAADQSWPEGDPDADGLSTAEELRLGADPFNADTNGDGIPDGIAARAGLSVTSLDVDEDGLANGAERAAGTDPLRADSDEDGVLDGVDCFPLDPTRSQCLTPDPGDHTPPGIALSEPASAVLISSTP